MTGVTGVGPLVRLAVRRDRVLLSVWAVLLAGMAGLSASATVGLYPDLASRVQAAQNINATSSLVGLYGRIYDVTALGALATIKLGGFGAALLGVLGLVLIVRHTRAEEEAGRLELVGAGVVGRYAALTAALLVTTTALVAIGALTSGALIAAGLPSSGSIAFGLSWAGTGIAFAAVGAVAAQMTTSARGAIGAAGATLGLAYLLRGIGDSSDPDGLRWLSWLSPVGWAQQVRPYAGDRWLLLTPLLALAVATSAVAYVLLARRDLGAGLLTDRPGPATAPAGLRSPLGLAWRLHRVALAAWLVAFLLVGIVVGNIASDVGGLLNSAQARDMILRLGGRHGLTDAFLAAEFSIVGVLASVYGVQAAMRLRVEETALRAEPLLATAVSRARWTASHTVVAVLGTTALMVGAGLGAGTAYAAHTGDSAQIGRVLGAALVQLPAVWVLTGVVVAAFGLAPRFVAAGWAALAIFLLIGQLGAIFEFPQWVMDLSPYTHVPRLPGGPFGPTPMLWLLGIAAALTGVGFASFRRRDLG